MAARRATKRKSTSKRTTPPTLAERIREERDLSEAAYLLADDFARVWDVRPGRTEHSTVLRDAWETIWDRGAKVRQVVRLLDQAADGSRYDMDDDFVAMRVAPRHLVQVGKRLCSAYVILVLAQRRYWRIRLKPKRPLRLGFTTTKNAPAGTTSAVRRWRSEQAKRHAALEDTWRELYAEILGRVEEAAEALQAHVDGLAALFEAIRDAEHARLRQRIDDLPRDDPRRALGMQALKGLHAGSRKVSHFRKAPSQLFHTWKQQWLIPRRKLVALWGES